MSVSSAPDPDLARRAPRIDSGPSFVDGVGDLRAVGAPRSGSNVRAAALVLACAMATSTSAHAQGERAFLEPSRLTIPTAVLAAVGDVLPEQRAVGTSFLSGTYDPNLLVTERATVTVTFVHEGAGYRNSLGYFTWSTDGRTIAIHDAQLVFPNASFADSSRGWGGGTLVDGDRVVLRDTAGEPRVFDPGDRIGFFLVANGWNGSGVNGWVSGVGGLPHASASANAASRVFTSLDGLNPEHSVGRADVSRHVAMVSMNGVPGFLGGNGFLLLGFEDLRRDQTSDEDFNDAVFFVTSTPETAIDTRNLPYYDPTSPDPDGDGVEGLDDSYPSDPERAFNLRTPAVGWSTIVFEDNYPFVGDGDYNDVVANFAFEQVVGADGLMRDLVLTLHLVARGASFDHSVGFALHALDGTETGRIETERFATDGTSVLGVAESLEDRIEPDTLGGYALVVDDVIASTRAALPPTSGTYTNTTSRTPESPPSSSRLVVRFDRPIVPADLGVPPYDLFLAIARDGERYDVHLPGQPPRAARPAHLPDERGPDGFLDDAGYPWAMVVPADWRFPLERVFIADGEGRSGAYANFHAWRRSRGTTAASWYLTPVSNPGRVVDAFNASFRQRNWRIDASR